MRYVVTELEGFLEIGGGRSGASRPGLSVQVIDRAVCHRVVASFRTEDCIGGRTTERKRELTRYRAAKLCSELNGTSPPSIVSMVGGGTCVNGHPRTPENTYYRSDGLRRCRVCRRESNRR